jgi:hypothetical protein
MCAMPGNLVQSTSSHADQRQSTVIAASQTPPSFSGMNCQVNIKVAKTVNQFQDPTEVMAF